MVLVGSSLGSLFSLALTVGGIALLIFVVMRISGFLLKLIVGVIMNTVFGFILLFAVKYFFGVTLNYTLPVIASIIVFGLPGVGTLLILKLGGVVLSVL